MRIVNPMGMHARPAGRFVKVVQGHDARVRVRCEGNEVDGASILSLLMLEAACGKTLEVQANGPDARALIEALGALVRSGFEDAGSTDSEGARG